MRKLTGILGILVLSSACYGAALNGSAGWNVTNNANGNSANAGCYDAGVSSPGTNATLSNPIAFTDLVASGTTATSATLAFSSTSVGNCLNVTSGAGGTPGRYEIISVSGSTATFNASIGTCTCSGNYGGALDTWAHAEAAISTAGQTIWIQITGTAYTITSGITGAAVPEHFVRGYKTAWNDQSGLPWASRFFAIVQSNTASMNIFTVNSGQTVTLDALQLQTSGSTFNQFAIGSGGSGLILENCRLLGNGVTNTVGIDEFGSNISVVVQNTEISGWYDAAFTGNGNQYWKFKDSYVHGNSNGGFVDGGNFNGFYFYIGSSHTVWDSNGYGIDITSTSAAPEVIDAEFSVFSNSTHDGINNQTAHQNNKNINIYTNNIIWSNGGWGINQPGCFSGPQGAYGEPANNNAVGNNTNGNYNCVTSLNDVTLSASSPFVSSTNFALNGGVGAALKQAAFPGGSVAATGYADIGAFQSQGSGSAAGWWVQ